MSAAIAIRDDFAYIGGRTDGSHEGRPHGGIMVVDISRPSRPEPLGPPFDAKPDESARELRVWQSQDILTVLNTNCGVGATLHDCTEPSISNIRVYDIGGRNAKSPELLGAATGRGSPDEVRDGDRRRPRLPVGLGPDDRHLGAGGADGQGDYRERPRRVPRRARGRVVLR